MKVREAQYRADPRGFDISMFWNHLSVLEDVQSRFWEWKGMLLGAEMLCFHTLVTALSFVSLFPLLGLVLLKVVLCCATKEPGRRSNCKVSIPRYEKILGIIGLNIKGKEIFCLAIQETSLQWQLSAASNSAHFCHRLKLFGSRSDLDEVSKKFIFRDWLMRI